jgi:hypothetical protein
MSFEYARVKWECENNPHWISVYDCIYCINQDIEIDYLILPFDFASGQDNNERRISAIEQGVFKPYPLI